MSTKIYTAYRIPVRRVNDFIAWFRETCFTKAMESVEGCMKTATPEGIDAFYKRHSKVLGVKALKERFPERYVRAYLVFKLMLTKFKGERLLDLDCWLNLWLDGNYAYVIPCYPDCRAETVKPPKWCDDYCYFDSTDKPKGISVREWKQRGRKWEQLCLEDHNRSRLSHVVIEAGKDGSLGIGLDELEKRLLKLTSEREYMVLVLASCDAREDQLKEKAK
jgi:hypothetical protein